MALEETPRLSVVLPEAQREVRAVLFDMDGVLVDSVPVHIAAWNAAFEERNLPMLERKTYLTMLGRTNREMIKLFIDLTGNRLSLADRQIIIAAKERHFRAILKKEPRTAAGVVGWLEFFKKMQVRCSVASSGEMANILTVLDSLQISDYFISIVSGAHLPASKPNPMIFELAAASLGVQSEHCMVVEDAPAGIQAAKAAKMLCCALATSFSPDELRQADIVLENLSQADPESFFRVT